jgi:HD superfamily phosphodiesterase
MEERFPEIFKLAEPYLQTRDNELHTRIAFSFALKLLDAEGGDREVVLPAVMLHDLGWMTIPEDLQLKAFGPGENDMELNRRHEVEGARIAGEILEQVGYDPERREEIVSIILGHDSRKEPLSLNDAVVKDSDKLWRFSKQALGLDPKRFGIDPGVHTVWLGHQIAKWFLTETAKKLALEEQRARAINFGVAPHSANGEE